MLAKAFWEDRSGDPSVKYAPGDSIPGDHPKREWLLRSKIAVATDTPADDIDDDEHVVDDDQDVDDTPTDDEPAQVSSAKPKPTDSVEAHREYLKARGVDPKGLTRPQLIKAVAGIKD